MSREEQPEPKTPEPDPEESLPGELEAEAQMDANVRKSLAREWLAHDSKLLESVKEILAGLDRSGDTYLDHVDIVGDAPIKRTLRSVLLIEKQTLVIESRREIWDPRSHGLYVWPSYSKIPLGIDEKDKTVHLPHLVLGDITDKKFRDTLTSRGRAFNYDRYRNRDVDFPTERDHILLLSLPELREIIPGLESRGTDTYFVGKVDKIRVIM